ncbi:MAG TPA: 3'-5' exonuclease [Microthrixaceae bacterium]|nr:3'-5' exonuclease [Microthrixaceae bacterium]
MSPPLYGLDIETDTTVDGLDPSVSPIVAVAVATPDGDRVFQGAEDLVLHRTDELMSELDPGIVVTWNGSGFDLPFLAERARRLGVTLGLDLWDDGPERTEPGVVRGRWYAHDHLDGYRLYRADVGRSLGFPCGLKPLSRLVGLAPVEVDRSCIHLLDDAALEAYVASDARLARELVLRRWPVAERATDRCHPRPPD